MSFSSRFSFRTLASAWCASSVGFLLACSSGGSSEGAADAGADSTTLDAGDGAPTPFDIGADAPLDAPPLDTPSDVAIKPAVKPWACKKVALPAEPNAQCGDDHWCWSSPTPFGSDSRAVLAKGAADVWVGGRSGRLEHWDGAKWTGSSTSERVDVTAFAAHPTDGAWMVDFDCNVSRWDGAAWVKHSRCTAPPATPLFPDALWVGAANDAWVVGENAPPAHWNGTTWTSTSLPVSTYPLHAVFGLSTSDVWAVGDASTVVHWDGSKWSSAGRVDPAAYPDLHAVWGARSDDVWLGGQGNKLYRWNGSALTSPVVPGDMQAIGAIWGTAANDVWFAEGDRLSTSSSAGVFHWDGVAITKKGSLDGASASAMAGSSKDDAWIVGAGGLLGRWDGGALTSLRTGALGSITSFWGSASNDVWAGVRTGSYADAHGAMLHFDGTRWSSAARFDGAPSSVWGVAPNDVWAAGEYQLTEHWDGAAWKKVPLPTTETITSLWGAAPDDVWGAAGHHFLHWDGTAWSADPFTLPDDTLQAITGTSSNDVWAATQNGGGAGRVLLLHWDGARWSIAHEEKDPADFFRAAYDIWAAAPNDVWILGFTKALHWDGAALSILDAKGVGTAPSHLWGFGANDVWAGGGDENIHWDGTKWSEAKVSLGTQPTAIWGCSADDVWMGGPNGTLLRRRP